jgi:polyhydroxybutyrate depolymerase
MFVDRTIEVEGRNREYRVFVPPGEGSLGILFGFHGHGDSKDLMPLYTRFTRIAEEDRYILVYPQGLPVEGKRGWDLKTLEENRDVRLFDALLNFLEGEHSIDPERVFAMGMSNGGYFCQVLVSQRSERLAAVVSHSGGMGLFKDRRVDAVRKIPVMLIHGDRDEVVAVGKARRMKEILETEGHPVEYVELAGHGHTWAVKKGINGRIAEFFRKAATLPR